MTRALSLCLRLTCLVGASLVSASAASAAPEAAIQETLSLTEALARFHDASPVVQQIDGRVAQAHAGARLATAPLQPIIAATGSYVINNAEATVSLGNLFALLPVPVDPAAVPDDLIIQPKSQLRGGVTAMVPLIVPPAWSGVRASRREVDAAEAGAQAATLRAEAALVKASWGARAASKVVTASEAALDASVAHHDSVLRRREAGLGTSLDALGAETEVTRRRREVVAAVAQRDQARRALGALLNVSGAVVVEVPDLDALPDAPVFTVADAAAHPDQRAADARVAATRAQTSAALLRHAPTLAATAAVMGSDVAFPTGLKAAWQVGMSLSWTLYDGGARYGQLDLASAQRQQAEASARQATLDVQRRDADAREAEGAARETLTLATAGAHTAAEAEAAATRLFEAGLVRSLDVVDARQRHLEAEVALAGAEAAVAAARADLLVATGHAWR